MALTHSHPMSIGWTAPDFQLTGADGQEHKLDQFTDKAGLMIVFTCNHCPYAQASWAPLKEIFQQYGKDLHIVAINPNDAAAYPADSFEGMQQLVAEKNIPFPYLHDEDQSIAKAYKAQCTPDPYLFRIENGKPTLFYHGRINDNWQNPEEITEENLKKAIAALIRGEAAPTHQPPSMGCSIKWKSN